MGKLERPGRFREKGEGVSNNPELRNPNLQTSNTSELPHAPNEWKPTLFDAKEVKAQLDELGYFELPKGTNVKIEISSPKLSSRRDNSDPDEKRWIDTTLSASIKLTDIISFTDYIAAEPYDAELAMRKKRLSELSQKIQYSSSGNILSDIAKSGNDDASTLNLDYDRSNYDNDRIKEIRNVLVQSFLSDNESVANLLAKDNRDKTKVNYIHFFPQIKPEIRPQTDTIPEKTLFDQNDIKKQIDEKEYFEIPAGSNVNVIVISSSSSEKKLQEFTTTELTVTLDQSYQTTPFDNTVLKFLSLSNSEKRLRENECKQLENKLTLERNKVKFYIQRAQMNIDIDKNALKAALGDMGHTIDKLTFGTERIGQTSSALIHNFVRENETVTEAIKSKGIDITDVNNVVIEAQLQPQKPDKSTPGVE